MKLSKLYCNKEKFKNIQFNLNGLNVVYADVKTSISDKNNAHNLGKTLFADLIDFLLLKRIDNKKKHFFYKEPSSSQIFNEYIFYLEILLNSGVFLTIKRSVSVNTKISFKISKSQSEGFNPPENWDIVDLSIKKAISQLNEYLNYNFFKNKNYSYRKAINYSLRRQGDYSDIYKLNKFSSGKHRDWKPFMFDLLGFDGKLLFDKYIVESQIEELNHFANNLRREFEVDEKKRDELVGQIHIKKNNLISITKNIDKFNFYNEDKKLIKDGIDHIESKISKLNTVSYNIQFDVNQLKKSIKNKFAFDLKKVNKVFEEMKIFFPKQLKKDYNELLEFNSKLTIERNKLLKKTVLGKIKDLEEVNETLEELNKEKEDLLSVLKGTDTFNKFKTYQKRLAKLESNLVSLNEKLKKIDLIIKKEEDKKEKNDDLDKYISRIKKLANSTEKNILYNSIRNSFSQYYKEIINETAIISWSLNKENNVDFLSPSIERIQGELKRGTSQGDGYTYTKLFCVTFDLAIVTNYINKSYFRFVYHDDVLANEDNGVKHRFLNQIYQLTSIKNFQYIFSVIKDDLPVDEKTEKPINFSDQEIILNLNDKDESGTLFGFNF
ncbi:DUF2326 domain-containing protein [Polaribacter vadi]|uniref:DUF2326 domain-containing protein n=1 Tax=Polaribacter TaxID=52959 RepID=UPI001C090D54|nr:MULTISPECIES: DUF2326 domain-containing protein [Polaribacter]MBU3011989.1 DUF2326 domain-containing protein [Polaribacter vadi]MDO6741804.1 DUF2326 domain-containing protein [Polaribacter sp. 1_MG-2023]